MLWCQRGQRRQELWVGNTGACTGWEQGTRGRRCLHKVSAGAEVPSQLAHSRCFPSWRGYSLPPGYYRHQFHGFLVPGSGGGGQLIRICSAVRLLGSWDVGWCSPTVRPLTNWNNLRHIRTRPLGEVGGHIKVLPWSIPALTLSHDESCKVLVVYVRQEVMRCLHEAIIATSPNWGSRLHQEMTTTWKFVTLNNIQLRRQIDSDYSTFSCWRTVFVAILCC